MLELYAKKPETAKKFITEYLMNTHGEAFKAAKAIREALVEFQGDPGRKPTDVFAVPVIPFVSTFDSSYGDGDDGGGDGWCGSDVGDGCDAGFGVFALILAAGALLFARKRG
jgi:hypothetical protein